MMNGSGYYQNRYAINRLIIEEGLSELPITGKVCNSLSHIRPEYIENYGIKLINTNLRTLILCRNRGKFLKPCPGTREYLCCLYNFLNVGLNCPIGCTYCILQAYLNTNALIAYINYKDMLEELESELKNDPSLIRIGTGELTDSLALDPLIGINPFLIDFFSRQNQGYLELKTKSGYIDHLLDIDHQGKTIISWSLNPQQLTDSEEGLADPLLTRIAAAKRCQDKGYKTGFHFDPIILYKGWESDYESLIDALFRKIDHRYVPWISMGCFRFIPPLKGIIQKKSPESKIIYGEFIPCPDKKMRYPQPTRINIYKTLALYIRKRAPDAFIYLCMESPEVWKKTIGYAPDNNETLKSWLDERCQKGVYQWVR